MHGRGSPPNALMIALVAYVFQCAAPSQGAIYITRPEEAVLKDLVPGGVMSRVHTLPPHIPAEYYDNDAHYQYTRFNMHNPAYHEWVKQNHQPLNHKYEEFAYTRDWDAFMPGGEAQMHPSVTVVAVACSPDRLPFVKRMLHHWQGPMALVIFIPHPSLTDNASACRARTMDYVLQMLADNSEPFALSFLYANEEQLTMQCNIHNQSTGLEPAHIDHDAIQKRYADKLQNYWDMYDGLYPINQARNTVVSMVKTNAFVMLVDADFVPSGLPGEFQKSLKADPALARIRENWVRNREREVLVIPAMERLRVNLHEDPHESPCYPANDQCWLYHKVDVPITKPKVVEMLNKGEVQPFYITGYPRAYGCVNVKEQWVHATTGYQISVGNECEPFFVGLRDTMPPFSMKFRGYQVDKVSYLQHMDILGTKFTVHPTHFLTHLPHAKGFNIGAALQLKMPARHDQWTCLRVSLALTNGENARAAEYDKLVRQGVPEEEARAKAAEAGLARQQRTFQYLESFLPAVDWNGKSTVVQDPPSAVHW